MSKLLSRVAEKFKKNASWFKDYLTEISVVVISIAITFYGDGLIEDYNNKQEDKEMIEMVKNELESNLSEISKMQIYYQKEFELGSHLKKYFQAKQTFTNDSLERFYDEHRLFKYWFTKKNAFDIIRVSGTVQRLDKSLLMLLFESYDQLNVTNNLGDRYREQRISLLLDFAGKLPNGQHGENTLEQWEQIGAHTEFKQYMCNTMPLLSITALDASNKAIQLIEDTLKKIKEKYPES